MKKNRTCRKYQDKKRTISGKKMVGIDPEIGFIGFGDILNLRRSPNAGFTGQSKWDLSVT